MSKKDRGAFQRKRAQKMAKQKAKKAKVQRAARHEVPLAYTGSRYQSERYVVPVMAVETAILTADRDSGGKLSDRDVCGALAIMVKHLRSGPQDAVDALFELRELEVSDVRQRQVVLGITAHWLDFFSINRRLPRADLVGILRTLINSLDIRTQMRPGGRGYLQFLNEFLPDAIAALQAEESIIFVNDEGEDGDWEEDDELVDEMSDMPGDDTLDEAHTIDVPHRSPRSDE